MESRMDEECLRSIQESTSLAEYFQNIVEDCKGLHPAIDDFVTKSGKLENQIRSTIFAFTAFIESLQKIAHSASNTKGSSRDIGTCLLKVSIHQKVIETQLKNFASSMSNWLTNELRKRNEESKKKIRSLDKHHMKEFKNVRNRICTRIDSIDKMRKKLKGAKLTEYEMAEQELRISDQMRELYTDYRILEKQEKQAVRRINFEERCQYSQITNCVKQVLVEVGNVGDQMSEVRPVIEAVESVVTDNDDADDNDNVSQCSSVRSSLRSVSSTGSHHSSRSQSPVIIRHRQHKSSSQEAAHNRLSYISLPGERSLVEERVEHPRTRSRPSSTYEILSGYRHQPLTTRAAGPGLTSTMTNNVRRSGSSSPQQRAGQERYRNSSYDSYVMSPPTSLQIYSLPDFNGTHRNMVFPPPYYDSVGLDEHETEDDLKTPTIENVLQNMDVPDHAASQDEELKNIRDAAIKQSAMPSGTDVRNSFNNNIRNNNMNNNNQYMMSSAGGGQTTKKMVYTQYREMLKRYEQSSRL